MTWTTEVKLKATMEVIHPMRIPGSSEIIGYMPVIDITAHGGKKDAKKQALEAAKTTIVEKDAELHTAAKAKVPNADFSVSPSVLGESMKIEITVPGNGDDDHKVEAYKIAVAVHDKICELTKAEKVEPAKGPKK